MVKLAEVYKRLAPAKNNNLLAVANQSTNDIINQVLSQHSQNAIEAKKICDLFEAGNLYETSKNIWNFLKYEVPYKVEPSDKQTTKTLSRMLFDAMTGKGNDCKHYAGFTGAVLEACGYKDWKYRFAGYSKYINVPTHVYCYAKDQDGIIYIDAVINGFDLEKPFVLNIDKKINTKNMSLYKLSGVDQIGDFWDNVRAAPKKAAAYVKKEVDKAADDIRQGAKTIGLSIPRNSFLLLVGQNVFNLASRLKNETFNSTSWWVNDWGGNRTDLLAAITEGKNKARIFGFDYDNIIYPSQLGMIGEPITIGTSITAALAIVDKVTSYLDKAEAAKKKLDDLADKGGKAKDFVDKGVSLYDKGKELYNKGDKIVTKLDAEATATKKKIDEAKQNFKNLTGVDVNKIIWKQEAGKTGERNGLTTADIKTPTAEEAKKVAEALAGKKSNLKLDTKTMLLIGGAGIALLLILKKK